MVHEHPEMKGEGHNTTKVGSRLLGLWRKGLLCIYASVCICSGEKKKRQD